MALYAIGQAAAAIDEYHPALFVEGSSLESPENVRMNGQTYRLGIITTEIQPTSPVISDQPTVLVQFRTCDFKLVFKLVSPTPVSAPASADIWTFPIFRLSFENRAY
ncbi:hypothetical protein VP1G_11187 [Cytospora mali]|uniref:Uncharacterized protein n=1 Tax=Cytospora mali TaxID=578113 RepID=A0A194V9G0_CYTMA|nr:hypothetical protein VP1G_11187 [Valsa mali var. pyri (nom. inval.)]